MQDCVSAYSKALNSHWNKAFVEGYVISKSKVKQNFLVLKLITLKTCIKSNSKRNKRCPKKQNDTILTKE